MPDDSDANAESETQEDDSGTLTVGYRKLLSYREYSPDGAYGDFSPQGKLSVEFYSEKRPLPISEEHEEGPQGQVGDAVKAEVGEADVVREVIFGVKMDLATAIQVTAWLRQKIGSSIDLNQLSEEVKEALGYNKVSSDE